MATRGGLDYRIKVRDEFTKPIRKFRQELLRARDTAKFVSKEIGNIKLLGSGYDSAANSVGNLASKQNQSATASRKATSEELQKLRAIRDGAKQQRAIERVRAAGFKDERRNRQQIARLLKAEDRNRVKAAQAREKASRAAEQATARASRQTGNLNRKLTQTQNKGNQLVLTFKRLAGVFVGFQAIRFGVDALRESISAGVRFNSVIEDSRIGMAAMFSTLTNISDAQGKTVTGADKFNESLLIADETLIKIRDRSLSTAATFPELAKAFRAGFAPGTAAGLNTDQIITVTERFSQILTGVGIAQNQINEEIRSFLNATATSRTSIIPTLFFGGAAESNRFVKQAKALGTLFPDITKRLKAFEQAAAVTQKTFTGTLARTIGILELAAGKSGLVFFESLKGLLDDVAESFATFNRTSTGFIESVTLKPEAVILLGQAQGTLTNIVKLVRDTLSDLDGRNVGNALVVLGAIAEATAAIVLGLFSGIVKGLSILGGIASKFSSTLGTMDLDKIKSVAETFGIILTLLLAGKAATVALSGAFSLLILPLKVIKSLFFGTLAASSGILTQVGKIRGGFFTAAGAAALIGVAFLEVSKSILGIELQLSDLPRVIGILFEQGFTKAIGFAGIVATTVKNKVITTFLELKDNLLTFFADVEEFTAGLRGEDNASIQTRVIENEAAALARTVELARARKEAELAITEQQQIQARIIKDANSNAGARVLALEAEVKKRTEAADAARKLAENIDTSKDNTQGLLDSLVTDVSELFKDIIGVDLVDSEGIKKALEDAIAEGKKAGQSTPQDDNKIVETFAQRLKKAFKSMGNEYAQQIAIMKGLTSQFSNFVSTEIVIALDPSQGEDGPSANERFKTFLNQIGKLIIQKLAELAIAKAILFAASLSGGGQATGAASGGMILGFDEGGTVPGGRFEAAQFRPAAVAISDTVPAWLTPGEFVTPVSKVAKYGADLLEGIRRGSLSVSALREAAGLTNSRMSVRKVRARGYADGGGAGASVSRQLQSQENRDAQQGAVVPAGPLPALVVSSDQQMDRLTAGGDRALRNWAQRNSDFFRNIVQSEQSTVTP